MATEYFDWLTLVLNSKPIWKKGTRVLYIGRDKRYLGRIFKTSNPRFPNVERIKVMSKRGKLHNFVVSSLKKVG